MADDGLKNSAKKMLEAMQSGKAKKAGGPPKAPPSAPKSPSLKTTNKMQGPDEDLMEEVEKVAAPKKKIASPSEASPNPPPSPEKSKAAPRSARRAAPSAAPPAIEEPLNENPARHSALLAEKPSLEEFGQLERDLPKGSAGGRGAPPIEVAPALSDAPAPRAPMQIPETGIEGPMTVGAIAAQLMLQSMPNGEHPSIPGGSLEANNESKLSQIAKSIPGRHGGMHVGFNPMAPENQKQLPQSVKPSVNQSMGRIMPGSPKEDMDRAQAQAYAEELRRNYPDQITK
jgi:hypothetical protein